MKSFFPPLYPDELLYSAFARYHQRSGNESYKVTMMDLFKKTTISAVSDFPSELSVLCHRINSENFNPYFLIDNHTLLPYFYPFITNENRNRIKEQMISGTSNGIFVGLGLAASKISETNFFRFCLHCLKEEIDNYGESYWHRTHQLPGVIICPVHKEELYYSNIPYRNKQNKHRFFTLDNKTIKYSEKILVLENFYNNFLFIAEQSYRLLNDSQLLIGINSIQEFYLEKLQEKGYITPSKRIRMKELIFSFLGSFEPGFLKSINCSFNQNDEDTWLHKVLRKPRVACHPLRHLLLYLFLNTELPNKELKIRLGDQPFGKGPWLCLNKGSNHYKELTITNCDVTIDSKTKQPVGTFICKYCDFIYSRRGPDNSESDKYKIGRIKNFGDVWLKKLKELNSLGDNSIRSISSVLGVDSKTVKKYLDNKVIQEVLDEGVNSYKKELGEKYKKDFLSIKNNNPNLSRTELRKICPSIYSWLYRNERDWFLCNLPVVLKSSTPRTKTDWKKRDEEYSLLIVKEALKIFTQNPLIRVTKTKIIKSLDLQAKFEKYIDKLPLSKLILKDVTETVEDFQIRRICIIGDNLRLNNINITKSGLQKLAGLNNNLSPKVKSALYKELSYFGQL
jgi:hypothetical protein